ncbi:unnamed protein product [Rhodiola kirilowii]
MKLISTTLSSLYIPKVLSSLRVHYPKAGSSQIHRLVMKLIIVALLLFMITTSFCTNAHGRPVDGKRVFEDALGDGDRYKQTSKGGYPESSIDNHHSIPRQFFNNQSGSSKIGDGNDDNDNGGG